MPIAEHRTAVVTGGASGIGGACALGRHRIGLTGQQRRER